MRWVLLAVMFAIGAVLWLAMGDDGAPPPAPQQSRVEAPTTPAEPAEPAVGDARTLEAGGPPPATDEDRPTLVPPPVADADEPMIEAMTLLLHVTRAADGQPVPAFRWRFEGDGELQRGEGRAGQTELALRGGARGRLLVEADGLQPFTRDELRLPTPPAAPLVLEVALTPAAIATGITLQVHDLAGQPIDNVQVDAFRLDEWNRDLAWQIGSPLWMRRARSSTGRYELPQLPPGEYGIAVLATDVDGNHLPLLPYRQRYLLTGSNGFVEDVTLEPGSLPTFELVEPNGQLLDPAMHGKIVLDLRLPGGPAVQRKWLVGLGEGATASALDALPGAGVVWPAEALPPGRYTFEVHVNLEPRAQQTFDLVPGAERYRVVVR